LNEGDVLLSFPLDECEIDDDGEVVPPVEDVPLYSRNFIVVQVVRKEEKVVHYVVAGESGKVGGQFLCD
jgi:hypothetical protein